MMKSRPYLKSSVKPALHFNLLLILLLITGCSTHIEPTYKEEDIPLHINKICKEEYNLEVSTKRSGNTLWIYAPLERIINKNYTNELDKIFDEQTSEKLRQIHSTIGRVIVSSDNVPEFYCFVASDTTEIGIDYIIIANTLDIKKSYANFIPWTEVNRRYVMKLQMNPAALGDQTGEHIEPFDIELKDFLAAQIAQRISVKLQKERFKPYFELVNIEAGLKDDIFKLAYTIKEIKPPEEKINIQKEILTIISYVLETYEFENVRSVEIEDLVNKDKWLLNRAALAAEIKD
jgi:hypothetical protein